MAKTTKNWKSYAEVAFNALRSNLELYQSGDPDAIRAITRIFYELVFSSGRVQTGLISKGALGLPTPSHACEDHFYSPQFVCRLVMSQPEIYLDDYDNFENLFYLCRHVIKVTSAENNELSQLTENEDGSFKIYVPTNMKYEHLGIELYEKQGNQHWKKSIKRENSVLHIFKGVLDFEKQFLVNE